MIYLDEVTYMVELLKGTNISQSDYSGTNTWAGSATAAGTSGHQVTPTIIDIRNMNKNTALRYDMSNATGSTTSDLIVVFENSQTINYPTISWDIRDETYTLTMHIRTIQDDRGASDATFARDRLESLYKIARHRLEANRKGATVTISGDSKKFNQIHLGSRTESNDRNKRIFGYKITVEIKKFATSLP